MTSGQPWRAKGSLQGALTPQPAEDREADKEKSG